MHWILSIIILIPSDHVPLLLFRTLVALRFFWHERGGLGALAARLATACLHLHVHMVKVFELVELRADQLQETIYFFDNLAAVFLPLLG